MVTGSLGAFFLDYICICRLLTGVFCGHYCIVQLELPPWGQSQLSYRSFWLSSTYTTSRYLSKIFFRLHVTRVHLWIVFRDSSSPPHPPPPFDHVKLLSGDGVPIGLLTGWSLGGLWPVSRILAAMRKSQSPLQRAGFILLTLVPMYLFKWNN